MFHTKNSQLTFVIIPDASSSVVRFRISKLTLCLFAFILTMIVIGSAVLYYLRIDNLHNTEELKNTLSQSTITLSEQDATINELQKHVIDLSNQAKKIEVKLAEMEQLEQKVKEIAEPSIPPRDVVALDSTSHDITTQTLRAGIGGNLNEVSSVEMIKLSEQTKQLLSQIDSQMSDVKDSLIEAKQYAEQKRHELDMTPSIWPTDSRTITSEFGYRVDPFSRRASFHSGLDISANSNTSVYATAEGIVQFTGYDKAPGNHIIIKHASGLQTEFMHLNKILVNEGDHIVKGQEIALSGNTGRSTGPHVHYEVIKDGTSIDPKPYLP